MRLKAWEINSAASEQMAQVADKLTDLGVSKKELPLYLIRLMFCLFADETNIFPKDTFKNFLAASKPDGSDLFSRLNALFTTLDTPTEKRNIYLYDELHYFRYINGNIFSEKLTSIMLDKEIRSLLLQCADIDWSNISLTIFGAMFQNILDPTLRRKIGAHYTSEENILKLIKPLFLDHLYDEFEKAKQSQDDIFRLYNKLASLKFLDPSSGSGNFLLVTYQELRKLEISILDILKKDFNNCFLNNDIKININQFYGIEYEAFPCEIAKVSLFLMKYLMDQKLNDKFGVNIDTFPVNENPNIIHANALKVDWFEVTGGNIDFIIGNPPYIGGMNLNKNQRLDIKHILKHIKGFGEFDYITAWFYKAKEVMQKKNTVKAAFVSTSSICQGQSVITFWKDFLADNNIFIHFAYPSFKWFNFSKNNASVHCVIVGFTLDKTQHNFDKLLINQNNEVKRVHNITPYLTEGAPFFIESRKKPIGFSNPMLFGNMPRDGGHLIVSSHERDDIIKKYPFTYSWFRKYIGAKEFINKTFRWVLWLVDVPFDALINVPEVKKRIDLVREFRLRSKASATQNFAKKPSLFCQIAQPKFGNYLVMPGTSSKNRAYIPIGYMSHQTIASNALYIVPNANLIDFSVLISSAHMAWMRTVAGRLEIDYRYSKDIVYNNFPIPKWDKYRKNILQISAQRLLDTRNLFPHLTFAALYDTEFMPAQLRDAHMDNDIAVWEAYGKSWNFGDEVGCVAALMDLYHQAIHNL